MKSTKNHFSASLESFDEGTDVMLDHTDTVGSEYEYAETLDGREIEICTDGIEGAETDIASLEALLEAIKDARDVGMESWSAQFATIQVNAVQKRYGINDPLNAMPSLECFNGRQARLATTVSMETVGETIAKVWAWIKEQFFKFIDLIKKFYRHLTKNLDQIIDEANKVKNVARQMKFDGGKTINLGRHGAKITMEGKIPEDFTSVLNQVGAVNRIPEDKFEKIRQDVEGALAAHKEKDSSGVATFTQEVPLPANFSEYGADTSHRFRIIMPWQLRTFVSQRLPGDRVVAVGVFGEGHTSQAEGPLSGKRYGTVRTINIGVDKDTSAKSLSSQDVFTLCQRIVKAAASLKTSRDDMERHFSRTQESINAIMRKHQKDDGVASRGMQKLATWFYKTNALYAGQLHRQIDGVGYDVCVGFLALAKKSVALHQTAEAA